MIRALCGATLALACVAGSPVRAVVPERSVAAVALPTSSAPPSHAGPLAPIDRPRSAAGDTLVPILLVVLFACAVAGLTVWISRSRRRLGPVLCVAGLAAGALALSFGHLDGDGLPASWVTVLHEGRTERSVDMVFGDVEFGAHAGPTMQVIVEGLAQGPTHVRDVVRLNLALAAINVALFVIVARVLLGTLIAPFVFGVAYVCNFAFLHSALSELPSQLLATLFFAGLLAAALLCESRGRARWLAAILLGLTAAAAAAVRIETLALSLPAIAMVAARVTRGEREVEASIARVRDAVVSIGKWPRWKALLLIAGLLGLLVAPSAPPPLGWVIDGVNPLNPSILTLPLFATRFLPIAVVVLGTIGFVAACRDPAATLLLPVGLVMLYRTYYAAAHGSLFIFAPVFNELYRYTTALVPVIFVLAVFGWREVGRLALTRAWPPVWTRLATVGLLSVSVLPPHHGWREMNLWPLDGQEPSFAALLVSGDTQLEVRYLVEQLDANPECVFVTRTVPPPQASAHQGDRYVVFGNALPRPVLFAASDHAPLSAATQALPGASCVRYYYGLDCNRLDRDACARDVQGLEPQHDHSFSGRGWSDPGEYGRLLPVVRLAIYAPRPT